MTRPQSHVLSTKCGHHHPAAAAASDIWASPHFFNFWAECNHSTDWAYLLGIVNIQSAQDRFNICSPPLFTNPIFFLGKNVNLFILTRQICKVRQFLWCVEFSRDKIDLISALECKLYEAALHGFESRPTGCNYQITLKNLLLSFFNFQIVSMPSPSMKSLSGLKEWSVELRISWDILNNW